METWLLIILMLDATLRVAAPLMLAAMAGLFSERAGIIDISLEGKMLAAAFAAGAAAYATGSPWAAMLAALAISCMLALLHSYATVTHRGDQVVSGLAANMLAAGLTVTLGIAWFKQGGNTPPLEQAARFSSIEFPSMSWLEAVPLIGPYVSVVYHELISGHNLLVYLALLTVPLTAWVLLRTRFGLQLRSVGEAPNAADTAGISVVAKRYQAQLVAGLLCGVAGCYLAIAYSANFVPHMTAGKGYIALAAMIFGKWRPWPAMAACLLFGFFEALAARLQGVEIEGVGQLPSDLITSLPYILTVILLAGFIGKATAPAAVGTPYVKGR